MWTISILVAKGTIAEVYLLFVAVRVVAVSDDEVALDVVADFDISCCSQDLHLCI